MDNNDADLDTDDENTDKEETRSSKPAKKKKTVAKSLVEWVVAIVCAVALSAVLRTYVLETFWIPSASMTPTLQIGDRVLVDKLSYRWGNIQRGDVVVFKKPAGIVLDGDYLVKRVIGVPGDQMAFENGFVYINGVKTTESYLPNDTKTLDNDPRMRLCTLTSPCVVPEGKLWVMGDNRGNSEDSRFPQVGYVDQATVVGKARDVIWPVGHWSGL